MIVLPVYRLVVRLFHFTVLINDIQTSNASFERTHIINILNFWIMKRIDNISEAYSHQLTAAPIDGKNVVEEALLEAIFDNSAFVSNKHDDSIGFINEWPASVHVAGNGLVLQNLSSSLHHIIVMRKAVERLTGDACNDISAHGTLAYLDDEEAIPLVYFFSVTPARSLVVTIFYAPE